MNQDPSIEIMRTFASDAVYKEEPDQNTYLNGYEPLETLPAAWYNWFVNKFTTLHAQEAIAINNIYDELLTVLTAAGLTPDDGAVNQLYQAIQKFITDLDTKLTDALEEETAKTDAHIATQTAPIHGSSVTAAPNTLAHRDETGHVKVADATDPEDATNLKVVTEAIDRAMQTTYRFIGYITPTEPSGNLLEGQLWYNASAVNTSFPWTVQKWNGSVWEAADPYTPTTFDLWSLASDSHGYYWFGNEWNLVDQNVDLSPYRTAAAQDAIDNQIKQSVTTVQSNLTTHSNATSVHGATSAATASRIIVRDSAGRAQVANPSAAADIATKGWVDAHVWDGSDITSGTINAARIPGLDASKITSGVIPIARGGTGATTAAQARTNLGVSLANLGVTATAAELNKLDGFTGSAGKLNFTNNVTSDIQAQLNSKQGLTGTYTQIYTWNGASNTHVAYLSLLSTNSWCVHVVWYDVKEQGNSCTVYVNPNVLDAVFFQITSIPITEVVANYVRGTMLWIENFNKDPLFSVFSPLSGVVTASRGGKIYRLT